MMTNAPEAPAQSTPPTPPTPHGLLTHQPYPYQIQGTLNAKNGKTLIADEPGLGKTLQAILYAPLIQANRTIIICPPALITNWTNEIANSNIQNTPAFKNTEIEIKPIYSKTGDTSLPAAGFTITSDTLLAARPALAKHLADWQPDLLILDEAHRIKNPQAKRTRAVLTLGKAAPHTLALTGTPIISSPLDLLPILEFLHHRHHYPANYLDRYTRKNFWGGHSPRHENLPELHQLLENHTWTRRTKTQVLKDLPAKTRHTVWVDVDTKQLQATLQPLLDDVHAITTNTKPADFDTALENWAQTTALKESSALRRATGLAKIPAAIDWAVSHHEGTGRPLIIWAIHKDVIQGIAQGLAKNLPTARIATYYGATPQAERDATITDFQAGRTDFLVAQIVAAGTGLTLTRACEALFAETDWTPGNVVQAEDRIHRISQDVPVTITTLIAPGTLDPVIHRVLTRNIQTLDLLTPGSDHRVTDIASNSTISRILTDWAKEQLQEGNQK